jgi:hypothetical protein
LPHIVPLPVLSALSRYLQNSANRLLARAAHYSRVETATLTEMV